MHFEKATTNFQQKYLTFTFVVVVVGHKQLLLQARFLWVLYSIINASLILKRNKMRLARNEMFDERSKPRLKRNDTHLLRNETRDGNLHLICTVNVKQILCLIL